MQYHLIMNKLISKFFTFEILSNYITNIKLNEYNTFYIKKKRRVTL